MGARISSGIGSFSRWLRAAWLLARWLSARRLSALGLLLLSLAPGCAEPPQEGGQPSATRVESAATGCAGAAPTPWSEAPRLSIHDIQGGGHVSAWTGSWVATQGTVTAVRTMGFYLQEPAPDADPATSEGLFVFTQSPPRAMLPDGGTADVVSGDSVRVEGEVAEFRPGCNACPTRDRAHANLSVTQIVRPRIARLARRGTLPTPVRIGFASGDRRPPTTRIASDRASETVVDVERQPAHFDAARHGLDFYESLEGMRVVLDRPVVVSPTRTLSSGMREVSVVPDHLDVGPRTLRGGVRITPDDFNPERVHLSDAFGVGIPDLDVGDRLTGPVIGVMDYGVGNFKLLPTHPLPAVESAPDIRVTSVSAPGVSDELTLATLNLENLSAASPPQKLQRLAHLIVRRLHAPDLLALQEVQDNDGPLDSGTVDASHTYSALIAAIEQAGGPQYGYVDIPPADNSDGGQPGANIRVGFLFRTDTGLRPERASPAGAVTAADIVAIAGRAQLLHNPARIEPTHGAFRNSRKPLVVEFSFRRQTLFVVGVHFSSKWADQPLFGRFQPPHRGSDGQRTAQAQVVARFVQELRAVDPRAHIAVMGDVNDFEFSLPVERLKAAGLHTLVEMLPPGERYTYNYQGNSQVLDHVLVSPTLRERLVAFQILHVNSDRWDQVSDHDPCVARFAWP